MSENDELEIPQNFSKIVLGLVIGVVILGGVVYATYSFSSRGAKTVLPSGFPAPTKEAKPATSLASTDCGKQTQPDPNNVWAFYIKCKPFTVTAESKWVAYNNPEGFMFELPQDLKLDPPFPNGVGFSYHEIPASANMIFTLDMSSSRSGEFKSMDLSNYPENYWRQFPGLTGQKEVLRFSNSKGVKGAKAVYVNVVNESPATDVFFELPWKKGDFVHFGSGVLSSDVFNKIIDTFQFTR